MPSDNKRQDLNDARNAVSGIRESIFLQKENLRKVEAAEEKLMRAFDPQNTSHVEEKNRLAQKKQITLRAIAQKNSELAAQQEKLDGAWTKFLPLTDPRQNLSSMPDDWPLLMFPLRIETRFKVTGTGSTAQHQLWVRVFPDDAAIDTFEKFLSESEIANAQTFWANWWAAAGNDTGRRGAWRILVSNHGAGRAQYIFNNYKPLNSTNEPVADPAETKDQVFLIVSSEQPLPSADEPALSAFWQAYWKANGDSALISAAMQTLIAALDADRAERYTKTHVPINIDTIASTVNRSTAIVTVSYVYFPDTENYHSQAAPWSQAAKVFIMPERLVLLGYEKGTLTLNEIGQSIPFPLVTGPDPLAEGEDAMKVEGAEFNAGEKMRWMFDFEEALKKGMAWKVNITASQAQNGFDRIIVAGVRMSADSTEGQHMVEELIRHHYSGSAGFSFLPVGTPTNNTSEAPAGYSLTEDADDSYRLLFNTEPEEIDEEISDWWTKTDREWFSELLGINKSIFEGTINTDGRDQLEARAMNKALWPATWGYFLESMMRPALDEQDAEAVRWFFNHFVTGRGSIPSIRIGNQPYGILPTTVFSRMKWAQGKAIPPFHNNVKGPGRATRIIPVLYSLFLKMQEDWKKMAKDVAHVGMQGDPHQALLDIVGLHSGSVEFHQRYAESVTHLYNLYVAASASGDSATATKTITQIWKAFFTEMSGRALLQKFGYSGTEEGWPEILEKLFVTDQNLLTGHLIDDRELSESDPIRAYTTDEKNYLTWLINAAGTSFEQLRTENGFKDDERPHALLYLMLHHALELGFWETSIRLHRENEAISPAHYQLARIESDFIHVRDQKAETVTPGESLSSKPLDYPFASESKYNWLYKTEPSITGSADIKVADYIPGILKTHVATAYLWEQVKALRLLENTATAKLERAFVEHLDCATYRFDAWKLGLINYQLSSMRYTQSSTAAGATAETVKNGIYIGAYGWLENVKSENKVLTPASMGTELDVIFENTPGKRVYEDNKNGGYIQAPSLNHAVTAAILRNGYTVNAGADNAKAFAVNLSSDRVRLALEILEGIRAGQSLGALLGYRLERYIHDKNGSAMVDQYIYHLRRRFPLVSNRLTSTQLAADDETSIEAIEARNVVDGLALITYVESRLGPDGEARYWNDIGLNDLGTTEKNYISAAIDHIRDVNDAVADLGMAESVHQVVQGNISRAAGTLETITKGNYPQTPDVVQTPRKGVQLTHRAGIQIEADADPTVSGYSPRAMGEPGLNKFLADVLPPLAQIIAKVDFYHVRTATNVTGYEVNLGQLGIQPIDLLFLLNTESEQSLSAIDELITHRIRSGYPFGAPADPPRPDEAIKITYFVQEAGKVSLFEIIPAIRHLRALLLQSRPLKAGDVSLANEATKSGEQNVYLDRNRIDTIITWLQSRKTTLNTFASSFASAVETDTDDVLIAAADTYAGSLVGILSSLSHTGITQLGFGAIHAWRGTQISSILEMVKTVATRWNERLTAFQETIDDYNALPSGATETEKYNLLRKAEGMVSTVYTEAPNPDPDLHRDSVILKRDLFAAKKTELDAFVNANHQQVATVLSAATALLTYPQFDNETTDFTDIKKKIRSYITDLLTMTTELNADLQKKMDSVSALLTEYDAELSKPARVELIQKCGEQLLTEEFRMIPSFEAESAALSEWGGCITRESELLSFQENVVGNPLAVDDWLYSVARVREKMTHLEQFFHLAEGYSAIDLALTPVQFPYRDPYRWFAVEFGDADAAVAKKLRTVFNENDHLLYTAYYHGGFSTGRQCGLLIDEWTEIVPAEEETAGIAFHYDRPNSEAPQALLLVTPPEKTGAWQWQDLVDALNETLDEAKLRAVEPQHIDKTGYAGFLPATVSMVTHHPVSIMLNYAMTYNLFSTLNTDTNE